MEQISKEYMGKGDGEEEEGVGGGREGGEGRRWNRRRREEEEGRERQDGPNNTHLRPYNAV